MIKLKHFIKLSIINLIIDSKSNIKNILIISCSFILFILTFSISGSLNKFINNYILNTIEHSSILIDYNENNFNDIYKTLIKNIYIKEEISEKIRLFYVALTRAKEKMIILADMNGEKYGTKDSNGVLDNIVRLNYRSFLDILISIKKE